MRGPSWLAPRSNAATGEELMPEPEGHLRRREERPPRRERFLDATEMLLAEEETCGDAEIAPRGELDVMWSKVDVRIDEELERVRRNWCVTYALRSNQLWQDSTCRGQAERR